MLELGLSRITKLLSGSSIPWRAVHVAGTNGKGSVCSYVSSMLQASGVRHARFTSPHLIDRWDCISVDGQVISENQFQEIERGILAHDKKAAIGSTEFELLTATAFEAFTAHKVQVGVVEVGLGGRLDATNVLQSPYASVITKIGMDHENLLGNTLKDIAYQKAGIMKCSTPCFIDGSNSSSVLQTLTNYANEVKSGPIKVVHPDSSIYDNNLWHILSRNIYADHQQMNITLAYEATLATLEQMNVKADIEKIANAVPGLVWPGRLQEIDLHPLVGYPKAALLDGAHNAQAALALKQWVDKELRQQGEAITWVVGMSAGKDIESIVSTFLQPNDNVITVAFSAVDGMPWVTAVDASTLLQKIAQTRNLKSSFEAKDVPSAVERAVAVSGDKPLVITGSLYLVSDVLRLLREAKSIL